MSPQFLAAHAITTTQALHGRRGFENSNLEASAIELGCMGMSFSYGLPKEKTE